MKGLVQVLLVSLALYHKSSSSDVDDLEMKEEELWNTDLKALMDLDGTDEMWITPGLSPLIGSKAVLKYFDYVFTHVIYRYKTEKIQEYDMASHLLVLYDYTCYSKTGEVTDNGTTLKFYEKDNGKTAMKLGMGASGLTPWPATTA